MKPTMNIKLYVMGQNARSERAIDNLRAIFHQEIDVELALDIIDVLADPQQAENDRILATPTLVKVSPLPSRRIIGDLTDRAMVAQVLFGRMPNSHDTVERKPSS